MAKDGFSVAIDKLQIIAPTAFEDFEGDEKYQYKPLFDDCFKGEGVSIAAAQSLTDNREKRNALCRHTI